MGRLEVQDARDLQPGPWRLKYNPTHFLQITAAQAILPEVTIDEKARIKISEVCGNLDVDGLRGDIVTNRAAKAHAAYNQRKEVTVEDIETVITLCLRHRLRKDPLESIDSGDKVKSVFEEVFK